MMEYKISYNQLLKLITDSLKLECLERDGVDNWGWYMEGLADMIQEYTGFTPERQEELDYDLKDLAQMLIKQNSEYIGEGICEVKLK